MEAIILVGGLGTRLRGHLPEGLPKPLAPIHGRPFLDILLSWLAMNGVARVVLSIGYGGGHIRRRYRKKAFGMKVAYSQENRPLGTGGAVKRALAKVRGKRIFILNGDSLLLFNGRQLTDSFERTNTHFLLAVRSVKSTGRYGVLHCDRHGRILRFAEKRNAAQPGLVSGGVYLADRAWLTRQFHGFPKTFSIERDFFEKKASEGYFHALPQDGYFMDIGIPRDYRRLQSDVKRQRVWKDWTLFLDRDGVINKNIEGNYVLQWKDFVWLPGVEVALQRLVPLFRRVLVVTNQRGIGRGLMNRGQLNRIHQRMVKRLRRSGIRLGGIFVCPHDIVDGCRCRKPRTGLFEAARKRFPRIDFHKSLMVGDRPSDWLAAQRLGMLAIAIGRKKIPNLATFSGLQELAGVLV